MIRQVVRDNALDLLGDLLASTAFELDAHLHSQHAQRLSTLGSYRQRPVASSRLSPHIEHISLGIIAAQPITSPPLSLEPTCLRLRVRTSSFRIAHLS